MKSLAAKQDRRFRSIENLQRPLSGLLIGVSFLAFGQFAFAQDTARQATPPAVEEDTIIVIGTVQFREGVSESALKIPLAVEEVPQSVTVVTEDVMELANIRRFDEIYRVDASAGTSNRVDEFPSGYYRGFATQGTNALRVDGFRFVGNVDLDLSAFDRFEVVKGPTSALYGQNTIGGALNASLKDASDEFIGSLAASYGSFDTLRVEADIGGALNDSGTIRSRFVGAYNDAESHIDFIENKHIALYGALAFDLTPQTELTLSVLHQDSDDSTSFGTGLQQLASGEFVIPKVPRSFSSGQQYSSSDSKATIALAQLDHELTDNWRVRMMGQYSKLDRDVNSYGLFSYLGEDGGTDGCCAYLRDDSQELYGAEVNLIGDLSLAGMPTTVFVGADYSKQKQNRFDSFAYADADGAIVGFYEIYERPGYNYFTTPRNLPRPTLDDFYYHSQDRGSSRFAGVTTQLLLEPTERLKLILAGRLAFDRVSNRSRSAFGRGSFDDLFGEDFSDGEEVESEKFVPQVGATYALTDDVNVYVNYGQTFEPNTDRRFDPNNPGGDGIFLDPEEGEQIEAGLKASLFDGRVIASAAAFRLERSNISAPDPDNLDFSIPVGNQRTDGVELTAIGNPTDNWNVLFSASILDAEFIDGELNGLRPVNTPKSAASIFTTYEVLEGDLKGLGAGLGYVYKNVGRSGSLGPDDDPISIDFGEINELSANLFYRTESWELDFNVSNILNDRFYSPAFNDFSTGINVNAGTAVTASVKKIF